MDAFDELSTDRSVSIGGLGPIPYTSLAEYARSEGLGDFQAFRRLIRALDAVYLRAVKDRADA